MKTDKNLERARVLAEALPYISRFRGTTLVVKYGGHAMEDPRLRLAFATDLLLLHYVGIRPVVVHGGGPQIGHVLEKMQIPSRFVAGLRITDDATMDVVEMVLGGTVNKEIVRLIEQAGGRAVGITGKDGRLVRASKVPFVEQSSPPQRIDPGRVGQVTSVNPEVITTLLEAGFIPVIAPLGIDGEGKTLNINADPFAAKIAAALHAEKLLLLTDIEGVKNKAGELLANLTASEAQKLIRDKVIDGGMIPKVNCGIEALREGVRKVHILDGRCEHALLLELFTDQGVGTELVL